MKHAAALSEQQRQMLDSYYSQLDNCTIKDRASLRGQLQKLAKRLEQQQPVDRMIAELESRLEAAQALKQTRLQALPRINYPDLPVASRADELKQKIADHQVVVVAGETGSGKTTQLPKICLDLGLGVEGMIGHTQPRRLAARTVASRVASELNSRVGELVGYQVRFNEQVGDRSLVKLMTDGILLAETQHDPLLRQYQVIIIDEAHERSLNIDFLLGYIKRILPKRPDLKLIITSATIDLERFSKHFDNAPVVEVSGRTFPVEVVYRPLESRAEEETKTQPEAIVSALEEIVSIDRSQKYSGARDVLVFLSGEREIREAADALRKADFRDTEIMPLYARLSLAEQNRVFDSGPRTGRRVVLATNVAETSVTVPGIRYVIDTGTARISRYSYRSKVQRLPVEAVSQASANQRAGRCGRIAPGTCIRLYSEEDFQGRPEFTDAEIRRTNLASVILQMLQLKLGDIAAFPFVDPPDSRFINDGFKLLEELGAVTNKRQMTELGRQLAKLPVDPRIARMVVEGARQGSLSEVLIIASALSVQDPRERPVERKQAADQKHAEYADDDSDFITMVNLWQRYEEQRQALSQNQLRKYCTKQFLSFMRMREWRDIHRQLHLACKSLKLVENTQAASYQAVHQALLSGLLSHIGFKQENREYLGARNRKFLIFPGSGQYKKAPKWLMAAELVETSKLYARMVAKIDPLWAEPLAGHLVKRQYLEPRWQKRQGQVTASEQVSLYGLILVPKRSVHFGTIDPETSQDIFIRQALVEGHFNTKGEFFRHNRSLLADVEELEAKSRRRDLVIDEQQLYEFYYQLFIEHAERPIVNAAGFERWRKKLEQKLPKALFLTEQQVMRDGAHEVTAAQFPDSLDWQGTKLGLNYCFEPGSEDDGVTLELPIALLKQFPPSRLGWLVPGLLRERCIGLLKSLPKAQRKHFVPIPNYIEGFISQVAFAEGELNEALCLYLQRQTGIRLEPELLSDSSLDDHYKMNVRLRDRDDKVIGQGRDWEKLIDQYGHRADKAIAKAPEQRWGKQGITRWDFDQLPETVSLKQAGGIVVDSYPVLLDKGASVDLTVASDKDFARYNTEAAIVRLAYLALSAQLKPLRGKLFKINESALLAGKVISKQALSEQILLLAISAELDLPKQLPRDKTAFEQLLAKLRQGSALAQRVDTVAKQVFELHQYYHRIKKQLSGSINLQAVSILNDIKLQLENLLFDRYLYNISWYRFEQYTRYMKGIEVRLEKYQRELPRQRLLSDQLVGYWQQLQSKQQALAKRNQRSEELEGFRWLLEEYRISLFAQQLGTTETVSDKRLAQRWRQICDLLPV